MPAARYDIEAEQGADLNLHLRYKDSDNNYIDLNNYEGRMQIRRSPSDDDILLFITNNGVTGGGSTGEFSVGSGVSSLTGGITFNAQISGATGLTGGILIYVDPDTMSNVPYGNHFYDFEIVSGTSNVTRLLSGRFTVTQEITR